MLTVLAIALAVFLYTYLGYPILVAALARFAPLRVERDSEATPSVTVLMAVYNGARYLQGKIESLLNQDYPADRLDILVYSDGSSDGSDEIVQAFAEKTGRVRLLRGTQRKGKPTALNVMQAEAGGEIVIVTDVRQTLSENAVKDLVSYFADPNVGCVSGNLVLEGAAGAGFYWRYEKWIRRSEGQFRSTVGVTGALFSIRRDDLAPLRADTILDDMWIPLRLRLRRKRLLLCETAVAQDRAFDDRREWARKTRTLAGNYQLFSRLPKLLLPFVNPSWFETFSHKILRLVSPWVLLVLFASSGFVALSPAEDGSAAIHWSALVLFVGQLLAYTAGVLGARAGRLGVVARTFVVLNAAAIVGFWRFLRGTQRIVW